MDFNETYTQLMNEKDERESAASKRARESGKEAQALLNGLNQFVQARRLEGCRVEQPAPTTLHLVKGEESLKVVVDGPGLFTVERNRGRPLPSLKEVSEDDMKRALVQWLCSEVAEPSTRR